MKINRIWVDNAKVYKRALLDYGVGDMCELDNMQCTIASIVGIEDAGPFAGQDVFCIALDVPSGTKEREMMINARHVAIVEFIGE